MQTISDDYTRMHGKCRMLFLWACEFNNQDGYLRPGGSVHFTDDNPYVPAWEHAKAAFDTRIGACIVRTP